jgi:multicomponent K+:H+ antiporter subunit G
LSAFADVPLWVAVPVAALVLLGAALVLTGALGLLRFGTFYQRAHAPTLGTTFGMASILLASMLLFTALQSRLVLHEILIGVFVTLTTPVTLMLLVQAASWRDRSEAAAAQRRNPKP